MKYIVVLGDGMSDEPIDSLDGKTPLAYARTPVLDELSKKAEIGLVQTIPEGMKPGSDTANLAVMGYDPKIYYSGRSPLEALSIGVPMKDTDIALRCNIITISEDEASFEDQTIIDHSSGEISTEDCAVLLEAVKAQLEKEDYHFYVGTSYRHCLIWENGQVVELTPPHDVLTQRVGDHLPQDQVLREMMKKSYEILKDHPLNIERKKQGLNPANCCWFWGAGTRPALKNFTEKTGKKGMVISAVDLLKGIAVGAGMAAPIVEGANGGLHTNYEGKTNRVLKAICEEDYDFVYLHIEAPDEMGHQGSVERKVEAIEYLDSRVLKPLTETLKERKVDFRLLVLPDHPTPVRVRTHTSDSVPYLLYDSTAEGNYDWNYNEQEAKSSGNYLAEGHAIIDKLFGR
ncbi:MAG: cofactor-independent phosphoglycerate mutase [Lachnospiraceae bacterium]|nr:cofactor-independent phosphoglycerate mutase [Lachnospiraceae bacterium]